MRIISGAEARRLLPMKDCIDTMARAMMAHSGESISEPRRLVVPLIDNGGFLGLMPGSARDPAIYGVKVVSLHPGNPARGMPLIQGFVALFDSSSGAPLAILDGAQITAIRTAAASGLATRTLARTDARTHGILGTGRQAVAHIDAIQAVRPEIDRVVVWGRSVADTEDFAAEQEARTGTACLAASDVEEAAACDIVSTVTASGEPVIAWSMVRPGAHVNLVGAHSPTTREADSALIARGRVYVDSMSSAMSEAGEILIAIREGAFAKADIVAEIGAVVAGEAPGRSSIDEVTVYKSLGLAAQDLFTAHDVLTRAEAEGIGVVVDL